MSGGRFPKFAESNPLSIGNPQEISGTTDARIRGNAVAQIGEHIVKMSHAIAGEEASLAVNQAKTMATDAQIEAEKTAKADGSDFQTVFQSAYDKKVGTLKGKLDPLVMQKADRHFTALDAEVKMAGAKTAFHMQHENFNLLSENKAKVMAGNVLNDPKLASQYIDELKATDKSNREHGVPPQWLNETLSKTSDIVAGAYVEGMVAKGRSTPGLLLQLRKELGAQEQHATVELSTKELGTFGLKANGANKLTYQYADGAPVDAKMSEILRHVSPQVREFAMKKIQGTLEAGTKMKLSLINATNKAAMHKQIDGIALNGNDVATLERVNAHAPPEFREQYQAHKNMILNAEIIVQTSVNEGKFKADALLARLQPKEDEPLLVREQKLKDIAHISAALNAVEKKKTEDPMQFVLDRDTNFGLKEAYAATKDGSAESMDNFITKSLAAQVAMHVPESVLSKAGATSIDMLLTSSAKLGPEAVTKAVSDLRAVYGDHMVSVMSEVAHYNPDNPTVALLGVFYNPDSINSVAKNLAEGPQIRKDFDTKQSDVSRNDFKTTISGIQDQLAGTFFGNEEMKNNPAIRAMSNEIDIEAKRQVLAGESVDDAVEKALAKVMSNYQAVPAGNKNIFVPRRPEYNVSLISSFAQDNDPQRRLGQGVGVMNAVPEWAFQNTNLSDAANNSYAQIRDFQEHAVIQNTKDQAGLELMLERNGRLYRVLDKQGNPMMKTFDELSRYDKLHGGFYAPLKKKEVAKPAAVKDSYDEEDAVTGAASIGENITSAKSTTDKPIDSKVGGAVDSELDAFKKRGGAEEYAPDDYYDNLPAEE